MPNVCKSVNVLFADDTNIETIGCTKKEIESDLEAINDGLERNKLVLYLEKTVQMNLKALSVDTTFYMNSNNIPVKPVCKYLGINLARKLSYQSHIDYVKERLSKQCGIVHIQQKKLLEYYITNVAPILQYGALVYCCCSYSSLKPISLLQKKILKLIHFRKKSDYCDDLFAKNSILKVYELRIYELLKFLLKAINSQRTQDFCNNLFTFKQSCVRVTRRSNLKLLEEPFCKRKIHKNSIRLRGAKLYNRLIKIGVISSDLDLSSGKKSSNFRHQVKNSYLVNNYELTRFIFE